MTDSRLIWDGERNAPATGPVKPAEPATEQPPAPVCVACRVEARTCGKSSGHSCGKGKR